ncbi:Type II secretory pathway, ATPase PulE/Tfp pilus assembly pathway, ATPase PilB [Cystobacter fuscus DSM 2262]|uniref:Type II secretory pathway, ATPase PulE/Tfp pilus assembly pathway, ATPase PilB n=1 Tax=Cystobacter fuscus (strain ATCC 25194 / DSM 2262 / NBRC 100088 / M29) TaxID=1242864 RepID=S9P225_CYSF2|nr:type II secretion pathway, ATPase PulE/Tfp pilus assembly pathway, ATPase PilB [Cystobacter fuscus]EPX57161.1 Type II secretory pathway, ATPase PulE/Tfp pilus assembly pathway, ATPase PilB [Cystobacter fuscus DSM 2262]
MRLGELLLHEKLITPEALEEALESQVVHGGRLGTNLVELGLLSEQELARVLGQQHGVSAASGEMVPDPRALALVDPSDADDKDYLPMRVDATRMSVAMLNPGDIATRDALAFKTGKRVVPVIIPEFRMNQLLRRYCKAFRAMRSIDMNAVRPSRAQQEKEKEISRAQNGDLISEEEFQSLYAQALKGGSAAGQEEPVLDLVETVEEEVAPEPVAEPVLEPAETLLEEEVLEPEPLAEPETPPEPVPSPHREAPRRMSVLELEDTPRPRVPAPEQVYTPLTFAEAQAELSRSVDREQVATTVLRFALGKWKRCLLLSVQGSLVTGWRGMGQGVREAAVRRMGIGLQGPSTFRLVRDTRAHYVGPVRRDAASGLFYKLLTGDYPTTAVILPLLVRGKLVHMLYVDNGPGQLTPPDVGELLILSQGVGRSYEAMIRRRKSA